jgi:hypothetical protein
MLGYILIACYVLDTDVTWRCLGTYLKWWRQLPKPTEIISKTLELASIRWKRTLLLPGSEDAFG